MNFKLLLPILILLISSCENPLTTEDDLHCIVDYSGFYDDCLVCSGGSSGHVANSDQDCNDECGGTATMDGCGDCDSDSDNDCADICSSYGCDDVCDSGLVNDECGVCSGENLDKDLCGICFGDNNTCNVGLITLTDWQFSQIHFWNNSDCTGFPYNSFYNEICLDGMCHDYKIDFYFDVYDGYLKFDQMIQSWNSNDPDDVTETTLSGLWYFEGSSSLCLDYTDNTLEDNCYESIEFENTYFSCEDSADLEQNCIEDQIILFSNTNDDEDSCSKEKYIYLEEDNTGSMNNDIDVDVFPSIIKNIFISKNNTTSK